MASDKGSKEALSRQKALESERQQLMTDIQREREKIVADSHIDISANRFVSAKLDVESSLKRDTIGLVQLNQFQKIREQLEQKEAEARKKQDERNTKRKQKSTIEKSKLSFDDEDAEEEVIVKRPKTKKDPTVNTRFLPDKEREEREALEREKLRLEWLELQEQVKQDPIEITFSYWDGHGHRSSVECLKGDSIDIFLSKARDKFPQIRGVGTDKLMFVKEDLIIPHHYTFYDFILNKARGKSGPLFDFGVSDDVRMVNDASKETTESHAAKIVERTWYERNKHVFPVNRWEVFDPTKDYGKYSIKDRAQML